MKKEVEKDLVNQAPLQESQVLPESNVQTAVAPEPAPVVQAEAAVGTPTPAKKNNFGEKLSALKTKLFSHGVGPVVAIATVAVVAIVLVVFGVMSSSPKQVFKGSINKVFKEVENAIDVYDEYSKVYDIQEKAILVNFDMSVDSNIEELKDQLGFEIKDLTLGAEVGLDLKNEMIHVGAEVKGEKEKLDATFQIIEDKLYLSSSLLDNVLTDEEELGIDFGELKDALEEFEKEYSTDPEDYKYLVSTVRKALNKAISSEYMEKEKVELDLGDDSFKATKYSYILDEDAVQELVEVVCEYLLDDADFVKVLSDVTGLEKSEIKDVLKEAKKSAKDIEFDEEIAINIYTKGLFNKAIGFGIEYEGDEYVTYLVDGKNAEFVIDNHVDDEYSQMKFVVTIEEDGKEQALTVKYNGEKIATGTIRELSEEVIDMSVTVEEDDVKGTFDIYLKATEKDNKISGEYKLKVSVDDEYISVKGNYGIAAQSKLDKVDTKKAVDVDDYDDSELEDKILEKIENDAVLSGIYELGMDAYEEEYLDLNYDGMLEIAKADASDVLTSKKAKVLYVGEDYYSYYSEADAYNLYENLVQAQKDLDFYSHFIDTYYIYDMSDFEELVKDVEYTCTTTTTTTDPTTGEQTAAACENYPAIYLIKDGKVQKAFRGTVSLTDLETALKDLGI